MTSGTVQAGPMASKILLVLRADLAGLSKTDICKECDISMSALTRIMLSPMYQERKKAVQEQAISRMVDKLAPDEVMSEMRSAAILAAKRNVELMQSHDERVAQGSIWDILDRTGYTKKQRTELEVTPKAVLTEDAARALGEALKECGVLSAIVEKGS